MLPEIILTILTLPAILYGQTIPQGFNYGSTFSNGTCRTYDDYLTSFQLARTLPGTNNAFASARLYTTLDCTPSPSEPNPITAIPAAIASNTTLLLGLWASTATQITSELEAIHLALSTYGDRFADLVVGISVGNEDLYRFYTPNLSSSGTSPADLVSFIATTKQSLAGTLLETTPIGHVDTFEAWAAPDSDIVIDAVDWLGGNGFPYWSNSSIVDASTIFLEGLNQTEKLAGEKEVWVTETGWPWSAPSRNQSLASVDNAATYWTQVGCSVLFGRRNVWWYILSDANAGQTDVLFGMDGTRPDGDQSESKMLSSGETLWDFSC